MRVLGLMCLALAVGMAIGSYLCEQHEKTSASVDQLMHPEKQSLRRAEAQAPSPTKLEKEKPSQTPSKGTPKRTKKRAR